MKRHQNVLDKNTSGAYSRVQTTETLTSPTGVRLPGPSFLDHTADQGPGGIWIPAIPKDLIVGEPRSIQLLSKALLPRERRSYVIFTAKDMLSKLLTWMLRLVDFQRISFEIL